jgi:PPE-repeat protein
VPDFGALPPEVNSGRMYLGPGSGPLLEAAGAWDVLAAELGVAAEGYRSVLSELTGSLWVGAASVSMVVAAAPYVAWLGVTGVQAEQTASQVRAAVGAYETAFGVMVPPPVIAANRVLLVALVATNFFGQNTAAIAAAEAQYAEMWAQDAAGMYGYAGAAAVASVLTPFSEPVQTTDPVGLSGQAAAVAKASGSSVGVAGQASAQVVSSMPQLTSAAVPQALQQLSMVSAASAADSSSTAASTAASTSPWTELQNWLGSGGWLGTGISNWQPLLRNYQLAYFSSGISSFSSSIGQQLTFGPGGSTAGAGGAWYPTPQFAGLGLGGHSGGNVVSANVGQAGTIGRLSVPQSWAGAAPPATRAEGPPVYGAGYSGGASEGSGGLLRGVPLTGVGRRASVGFVHRYGFRHSVMPRPPSAG